MPQPRCEDTVRVSSPFSPWCCKSTSRNAIEGLSDTLLRCAASCPSASAFSPPTHALRQGQPMISCGLEVIFSHVIIYLFSGT
jgi:hypothetical protein